MQALPSQSWTKESCGNNDDTDTEAHTARVEWACFRVQEATHSLHVVCDQSHTAALKAVLEKLNKFIKAGMTAKTNGNEGVACKNKVQRQTKSQREASRSWRASEQTEAGAMGRHLV